MAKHKPINRIVVAGLAIGVLIAVIAPVMIFVFGVGESNILPQANPNQFKIPFITPEEEKMNKEILGEIKQIVDDPAPNIVIDPVLMKQYVDCNELILSASKQNSPDSITAGQLEECNMITQEYQNQTIQKIDDAISKKEEEIIVPPAVEFPVNSSMNDPFTQLCDQNPSLIVCGKTTSLELITKVLKQDSNGVQTTVETATKIPQLSFFVEDTSNIDYKNGKLQFNLIIKGDPNLKYTGNGKVDLLIGDQSIFSEPVSIKVDGTADSEGKVDLLFVSPTGGTSDLLLFDFVNYLNKFPDESVTPVRLHIIELNVSGERQQNFALIDSDVFTMDITRSETKLLITNEAGIISRVYPSDSRLILSTITGSSAPYSIGTTSYRTFTSDFFGNGRGCSPFYVSGSGTYGSSSIASYPVPPPTISGVSIIDSENNVLATIQSGKGTVLDFTELTRDQNYTLKVTSPTITSSTLVYGKSQETKSFTCQQSATINLISTTTSSGSKTACGTYTEYFGTIVNSANPLTLGAISCNIP